MGYYADGPPCHSHRSPAEIAQDDRAAVLRGDFSGALEPGCDAEANVSEPLCIPRRRALVKLAEPLRIRREQ